MCDSQSSTYASASVHKFKPVEHGASVQSRYLCVAQPMLTTMTHPLPTTTQRYPTCCRCSISRRSWVSPSTFSLSRQNSWTTHTTPTTLTHTNNTSTNTIHRTNAISHCTSQVEERHLTDRRYTDNVSGSPKYVGIPPPMTTTVSEHQHIPLWLLWLTGQHQCLTRLELPYCNSTWHR